MVRDVRGQISFEYLVIVGLAILVIVPALLFFLTFASGGDDAVAHTRVAEIGSQFLSTSSEVFSLGRNSWLTLDVTLPETIENISINHNTSTLDELIITYRTKNGPTDAVFFSDVSLGNASADPSSGGSLIDGAQYLLTSERVGVASFRLTSAGEYVWVELR